MKYEQYFYYRYNKITDKLGKSDKNSDPKGGVCISVSAQSTKKNSPIVELRWGVAICSKLDNFNKEIGKQLANSRDMFYTEDYEYFIIKEIANFIVKQDESVLPFINIDLWVSRKFGKVAKNDDR